MVHFGIRHRVPAGFGLWISARRLAVRSRRGDLVSGGGATLVAGAQIPDPELSSSSDEQPSRLLRIGRADAGRPEPNPRSERTLLTRSLPFALDSSFSSKSFLGAVRLYFANTTL